MLVRYLLVPCDEPGPVRLDTSVWVGASQPQGVKTKFDEYRAGHTKRFF